MSQANFGGDERRKYVRIPFWFVTKYKPYAHGADLLEEFGQGIGKNISVGGICFETNNIFETGTLLEVELDMPALSHGVCVVGKIVWTQPSLESEKVLYGLSFTKINNDDMAAVRKIVETFE